MSTLKVTALKNPSSSANNIVLNSDGTISTSANNIVLNSDGTISTTALKNPSSSSNNIVLNADGTVSMSANISVASVTSTGDVSDSVSNVRTPRITNISTATTIADEGVYYVTNNPTVTLGAPATGTIMTLYNSSGSSMTLARGSTVVWFRKAADNDTVSHTSVTLGAYSTTTVTFFSSTFAVVTGTDVS